MSPPLLMFAMGHASLLAGVVVGLGALASVLRVWIEQANETRRFERALADSDPGQRPAIILALGNRADQRRRKSGKPSAETRVDFPHREKLALLPQKHSKD